MVLPAHAIEPATDGPPAPKLPILLPFSRFPRSNRFHVTFHPMPLHHAPTSPATGSAIDNTNNDVRATTVGNRRVDNNVPSRK
mmetsp:Transcript_28595/g.60638  ORF Transcript_28595/g.60638 Transcript_28595/m.60638 type:complete len:83 (-) Transcript_28595:41-289(-)